ncbi:g4265 [Coccomyxa viridis]|uniref:G4265 protein n=1 Tax=Coccomyxa viridis TaxID=1274662 RepID=A0ABP1FWX7_9CHLO
MAEHSGSRVAPSGRSVLPAAWSSADAVATNISFHTQGRGTLAPWIAPKRLVVQGLYRYTRNPMFWGAFSVVFGEALIFNSRHLLYHFLLVVAMQMVHVPLNEERWLRRGFGAEYDEHVPRWLPRRTPYELRSKSKDI